MVVQGLGALLKILDILQDMENEKPQNRGQSQGLEDLFNTQIREPKRKVKRKVSAYHRRYSKAFKKLAPRNKLKSGSWKKNGFKLTAAAARKVAKK